MAIDGTPPFKLPPGAQPILLNDFDILTITQFPVSGAGPYTVPSGRRLVITGAAISFVELTASPPAGGRDVLIQADLLENDGHALAGGQVHTVLGIHAPPVQNAHSELALTNLALAVPAGSSLRFAVTAPYTHGTNGAAVIHVWGWLEAKPA